MKEIDDDEPFIDIESAAGWDPRPSTKQLVEIDRKKNPRAYNTPVMLHSRPLQEWMGVATRGLPAEQLFGPFWQNEELTILFAGTGLGKSALAVQIAESLARGSAIAPFAPSHLGPQRVLYLDFELKLTQLAMRYSCIGPDGFSQPYRFSDDLIRSEMYWNGEVLAGYEGFSDMFFTNIRNEILEHSVQFLIVDNITYLDRSSTSNTNIALSIMRNLDDLRRVCPLSILVLAHTPKRRAWEPLTELDLQGSINLANFADSMFAMGRSRKGTDLRYLKQIKVRSGRPEYGSDNVPVFSLEKFDYAAQLGSESSGAENFLGLKFVEFSNEFEHLAYKGQKEYSRPTQSQNRLVKNAKRLAKQGKSCADIASKLGISKTSAYRYAFKG